MKRKNGFTLIDCLMAILILGLGMGAITQMIFNYRHFLDKDWERQTAWEILSNMLSNHESYSEQETRRHFNFRGLPQPDPDRYEATIWTEASHTLLKRVFEVSWMDSDNEERHLEFERLEWRDQ